MAARIPSQFVPPVQALLGAVMLVACGFAFGSDHPPAAAAAPASSSANTSEAAEPTDKAAAAKRAPKAREPIDPMDRVRERLAQKLAGKTALLSEPDVVRVVARPTPAPLAIPAAAPPAQPRPAAVHVARAVSPASPAMALATAHRAAAGGGNAAHGAASAAHWDYAGSSAGAGPEAWGQMKPEFAKCSTGTRQSPIDIRDGIRVNLDPVQFDYKPSAFKVIDTGHTVQVNVGAGNSIEVGGRRFELVQFHFHRPSEERINGKQFDMVAHLVHKDIDGRLAVVAVLLDRGSAHPLVQSVWNNLPLEKGDEVAARATLDMNALLPAERSYFTYMGSLTTPPCSEGVLWMVMKTPMPVSPEQVGIFARLYPMNARPIQSASGRLIKESN